MHSKQIIRYSKFVFAYLIIFSIISVLIYSERQDISNIKKNKPFENNSTQLLEDNIYGLLNEIIAKIEFDLETTSTAFADAQYIQRSLKWADIFGAGLDIVTGTISTISSIVALKTNLSEGIVKEVLNYDFPLQAFSGMATLDSLIYRGETLQLALDGPSYFSSTKKMLDYANKESSTLLFFNYEAYQTAVKSHLLGTQGFTPLITPHRSSEIDRKNIDLLVGAESVEKTIRKRLRDLAKKINQIPIPVDLQRRLIDKLKEIRGQIKKSKLSRTKIGYRAFLREGDDYIIDEPELWLGNISEFEKVRKEALANLDDRLQREEIMTISKTVSASIKTALIYLDINYPSSMVGKDLGRISKLFILPNGINLSEKVMKSSVYKSNPRERINMLPQEMLLLLPKELSDLLMIADDTANYIGYYIKN